VNDIQKSAQRRKEQRESIKKLIAECVRMVEYEPGKYWALVNLPGMSSHTFYKGCIEGHAKMLTEVVRGVLEHALVYAALTSEGIGEEAYGELHARGFVHHALDFKRHGVEIANAIAALQVTEPVVASAAPEGERGASASGDSGHPSFLSVPPSAIAEFETEVDRG
jgi:hypothetical protein